LKERDLAEEEEEGQWEITDEGIESLESGEGKSRVKKGKVKVKGKYLKPTPTT
jgi:hypothetical protein